jgi:hypothetical protein
LSLSRFHQTGKRKIAMSILLPTPSAQTCPRLAIPALLDQANDPKPAIAVPPQSKSARPTELYAASKSP